MESYSQTFCSSVPYYQQFPRTANYFSVIHLCSAFFQHFCRKRQLIPPYFHLERSPIYLDLMPRDIQSSTYFFQILKTALNSVDFPRGSNLFQYVYDLLLCFSTLIDFPKDTIYPLQQLAIKGHKVSKDML